MNKQFTLFFCFFSIIATAQVPNHGFEDWTAGNPDDWQTSNIPIMPTCIFEDSDSYAGHSAVRGVVVSNNFSQPYAPYLGVMGPAAQGFSISTPLPFLKGHYKLDLHNGDKFVANVHIYNSFHEPAGEGHFSNDSSFSQWHQFLIPIDYSTFDISMTCSLFFTITESTEQSSGHIGSSFILDNLSMYGAAILNTTEIRTEQIRVYPQPATDNIHVSVPDQEEYSNYTIADVSGKKIRADRLNGKEISVSDLQNGIYFLNIHSAHNDYFTKILVAH